LIAYIFEIDIDVDKRKTAFTTTIDSTSNAETLLKLWFTNNKVLLSHFEPPKFNIALATLHCYVYDNAVAFGSRDFAANEISTS